MKATYHKHILQFKRPSGTSRGILKTKETWFITIIIFIWEKLYYGMSS